MVVISILKAPLGSQVIYRWRFLQGTPAVISIASCGRVISPTAIARRFTCELGAALNEPELPGQHPSFQRSPYWPSCRFYRLSVPAGLRIQGRLLGERTYSIYPTDPAGPHAPCPQGKAAVKRGHF